MMVACRLEENLANATRMVADTASGIQYFLDYMSGTSRFKMDYGKQVERFLISGGSIPLEYKKGCSCQNCQKVREVIDANPTIMWDID